MQLIEAATMDVWGNSSDTPNRRSVSAQQKKEMNRLVRGSMHEIRDTFKTAERLEAFAVVGVTEEYDRFLALVSLVFGWPVESLCYERKLHSSRHGRPSSAELNPLLISKLRSQLTADTAIYEAAKVQHKRQAALFGDGSFEARVSSWHDSCGEGTAHHQGNRSFSCEELAAKNRKHPGSRGAKYNCNIPSHVASAFGMDF
jgi:hypothetical protein